MPLLTRFYGIQPADIENFTLREISEYQSVIRRLRAEGGEPWQVAP